MNIMNMNTGAVSTLSSISATSTSGNVTSNGTALQAMTFKEKQPVETVTLSMKDFAGQDPDEKAIRRIVIAAKEIRKASAIVTSINGKVDTYILDDSSLSSFKNEAVLHINGLRLSSSFGLSITVSASSISNTSILVYTAKRTVRR